MKVGGMNYIVCVIYPMFGSFEGEERIRRKRRRGEEREPLLLSESSNK
jgi:hypothetical protein